MVNGRGTPSKGRGISYRSVREWKGMLAEFNRARQPEVPPGRLEEMIEGWLMYIEPREASMPPERRWECEGHLNLLFRRLSRC